MVTTIVGVMEYDGALARIGASDATDLKTMQGSRPRPCPTDADLTGPLYTPPAWQATARPPSPIRVFKPKPERMASAVVESVLAACRRVDRDATLASATYTQEGQTLVRIRSGASGSVTLLRRALQAAMPLAVTDVTDSPLDGTCEAAVTVPQGVDEQRAARNHVRLNLFPRLLFNAGVLLLVAGIGAWASKVLQAFDDGTDAREL